MSRLIVFCGPPCSGKSLLAGEIALRLGITHLQMDEARERLLPASRHGCQDIDTAYRAVRWMASLLLGLHHDVIVDSTYGRWEQRRALEEIACEARAPMLLIQCKVSEEIACSRFARRPVGHAAVDLTRERVALLVKGYPYCAEGLILDTGTRLSECASELAKYLADGGPVRLGEWSKSAREWRYWPGPKRGA